MAIRLKDYEGTKRLERQREEAELWEEWRRCTWSDAITPRGDIDECIRAFRGEVITQDDIPDLKKVVEWDKSLSEDDRDYIRGLIKAVEEEAQSTQAVAFTTQEYLARRGELLAKWNSTEWIDGGYSQLRLSMPERVKAFTADVPATEALSFLQLIADQGEGMTQEERAYLREYVKQAQHPTPSIDEVTRLRNQLKEANHRIQELEAWQTFVPPTQEEGVDPFPERGIPFSPKGSTLSPREVGQAQELEQAHARISELEEELQQAKARIQELEADQEEEGNPSAGRAGLLGLSCTQCLDAFALLLEEATGVPILKEGQYPQGQSAQKRAFTELYSLVTGKALRTCEAYTRQRTQPNKQPLAGGKATKAGAKIKEALQTYRGSK